MFSKYKQKYFIQIQIARTLDNAIQRYWKLVVERLYHIILLARWTYAFCRGREDVLQCHTSIIAVEESVRRLVGLQQDAVDGICRLPDVWRRVLHVGGDYF